MDTIGKYAMIAITIMMVVGAAADVGKSRADAMKTCYEAAKVNTAITCNREPQ